MSLPILYTFRRCPYAIRARMALLFNKQSFIVREVSLKNKPKDLLEISPKATVPVMLLADGSVIEESIHIMHWAFEKGEIANNHKMHENEILVIEQLISENDGPFKYILDRYKYPNRYPNEQNKNWQQQADKFLSKLEMFLQHNKYLFGNNIAIEDLAIMPFVRQFKMVDEDWFNGAPYPKVNEWLNSLIENDVFKKVMNKYEPWKTGDKKIIVTA